MKICGLSRLADVAMVNLLQPDYIGFVFAPSRRKVTRAQALELKKALSPSIQAVGVFVGEEATQIAKIVEGGIIDVVQLHGDETPEFCALLKQLTPAPIIKVIRVKNERSLENLEDYPCDYFLFDTYSHMAYGGLGKEFDYSFLRKDAIPKPFFIAGGLRPDNVWEPLQKLLPYGVDVSGGVETDGFKNEGKIKQFIKAVRKGEKQ